MSKEIDDIFCIKKTIKKQNKKEITNDKTKKEKNDRTKKEKNDKTKKETNEEDEKNISDSDDFDIRGTKKTERKYTEDGFTIYDKNEIKFGKNLGDTKDCPFDCRCCF